MKKAEIKNTEDKSKANKSKKKTVEKVVETKKEIKIIELPRDKQEKVEEEDEVFIEENSPKFIQSFATSNSSPSMRPIFSGSQGLEEVVGNAPIKKEEEKNEDIKYSEIKYNAKKDDYSFNSNSYITPSGKVDLTNVGRNEPQFRTENASFNRGLGDLAGVKEEKNDYHIRAGERVDTTKRKSIFEMEQEKLGDIKSQKYYQ